jgi:hypothetical protein
MCEKSKAGGRKIWRAENKAGGWKIWWASPLLIAPEAEPDQVEGRSHTEDQAAQ